MQQLTTPLAENFPPIPWEEYPRPQTRRESYVNLNGIWEFGVSQSGQPVFDRTIRVPFCPESALSGIGKHFPEGAVLCYRRKVSLPEGLRKERVLLHIGAADQVLECYVNGLRIGSHEGGYNSFCFDITEALGESNELILLCRDDLRDSSFPYGKQTQTPGGMFYTPVSGIWQTVWLESVPENYIQRLTVENRGYGVTISVFPAQEGTVTVNALGSFPLHNGSVTIQPEAPRLWSPEDPYLYEFSVQTAADRVDSYFALRQIESKTVDGIPRLCLNGKPYFFHGLLDQGYWPEGLLTPPSPDSYREDILAMKKLGFNTLRKHIKVEPEAFYYACDRLGMVVFQDMVNNGDYAYLRDTVLPTFFSQHKKDGNMHRDPDARAAFLAGMEATVRQLKNHPCICYWTIFNEGWGQFDSETAYRRLKELDSSRFIDTTSGWFRGSTSDVESLHIYFGMWHRMKPSDKPIVLSEFGGFTYSVPGHIYNPEKSYGYGTCKTPEELTQRLREIYEQHVIPAISKGLCAAIYTQVSDVEDEINGLVTYDRKVVKPDEAVMLKIAEKLKL